MCLPQKEKGFGEEVIPWIARKGLKDQYDSCAYTSLIKKKKKKKKKKKEKKNENKNKGNS